MAASSVIVHDIDRLEAFGSFLVQNRDEIERLYDSLTAECFDQGDNWSDPQYESLKENISSFALASKTQLELLEESASYIANLVIKLRDV